MNIDIMQDWLCASHGIL